MLLLALVLCILPISCSCLESTPGRDDFNDPPAHYRPKFRYWLPDASVSSEIVATDIREMKAVGAGGLEMLPFYLYGTGIATDDSLGLTNNPVANLPDWNVYGFGTPAFVSLFKDALNSAKEAGVYMDFALGCQAGQGVPSEPGTAGLAVELLMGNATIFAGANESVFVPPAQQPGAYIQNGFTFMLPQEPFGVANLTSVIAYEILNASMTDTGMGYSIPTGVLNETSYIDLTFLVQDDLKLSWQPPKDGKAWKIFSFWESYTNQRSCRGGSNATDFLGNGSWIVDHFSMAGASRMTQFWDDYILADTEVSDLLGKVGKYAWEDSVESTASLYWSPDLLARFQATHKYDLTPYLPLLYTASNVWTGLAPPYSELYTFKTESSFQDAYYQLDYRKVLNDGYQDYIQHFQAWAHSMGIEYSHQPAYNLPVQMLSDIPLIDAPEGESLAFEESLDVYRQFSGPAHLFNKSVISTELGAVRSGAYGLTIPSLLQKIKRSFAGGFTMNVIHGFPALTQYPNTTWPGYTTFWFDFTDMWNQIQPAWRHMRDVLDYVGRNQWALQQGTPKIDLAFYLYASPWTPVTQYNSTNLQDLGFTYEYLGPDKLASSHAQVQGRTLGDPEYKALIFNKQSVTTAAAVNSLLSMAADDLLMIFVGHAPDQAYPHTDQSEVDAAMNKLLTLPGVHRAGSIGEIPTLLADLDIVPRVALNCSTNPVTSVYRSGEDTDYVFFFNDQNQDANCNVTISTSKTLPQILDAWSGSRTPLPSATTSASTLTFPLHLKSNETLLLALSSLSSASDNCHETAPSFIRTSTPPLNLTTWNLTIEDWHSASDRFAVQTEITHHNLTNIPLLPWHSLSASLLNVSGIGHYTTPITPPHTARNTRVFALLSLPPIQHTVRVFLDGARQRPIDPVNPSLVLGPLEGGRQYEVRVEISTTLLNRVKADASEMRMAGMVPGAKYEGRAYESYGLVGSVVLEWGTMGDSE